MIFTENKKVILEVFDQGLIDSLQEDFNGDWIKMLCLMFRMCPADVDELPAWSEDLNRFLALFGLESFIKSFKPDFCIQDLVDLMYEGEYLKIDQRKKLYLRPIHEGRNVRGE